MADRINKISTSTTKTKARTGKVILSKGRLLITTVIIILLMGYIILGGNYLKGLNEQKELTAQIAEVNQTLSELPQPANDLEQQLTQAEASLAGEQGSFPEKVNTTQIINTILGLANSCQVKATPMVTQAWSEETIGIHTYQVLRLTVTVDGDFSKIRDFASRLIEEGYTTLVMENLSITQNTEESEGEEGTAPITGSLKLAIYTRSQSSD